MAMSFASMPPVSSSRAEMNVFSVDMISSTSFFLMSIFSSSEPKFGSVAPFWARRRFLRELLLFMSVLSRMPPLLSASASAGVSMLRTALRPSFARTGPGLSSSFELTSGALPLSAPMVNPFFNRTPGPSSVSLRLGDLLFALLSNFLSLRASFFASSASPFSAGALSSAVASSASSAPAILGDTDVALLAADSGGLPSRGDTGGGGPRGEIGAREAFGETSGGT
mmetsp:Transcript_9369/g.38398  ORF Transcript_9369/g.38398 Transcript_9369/m.38398 type:complete len:225 (-) Transcript_9369:313-987(-)